MPAGRRDTLVTVESFAATRNTRNDVVPVWAEYCREWADVRWGTPDERINAAAVGGAQSVTLTMLSNNKTRAIGPTTHRVRFSGAIWNITGVSATSRTMIQVSAQRDAT